MNEYLITALATEHRQVLLDEAQANGLARIATQGRPTFWAQLRHLLANAVGGRRPAGPASLPSASHRLAH